MAAKLPNVQTFGESPAPQQTRAVAGYDPSYSAAAAKTAATDAGGTALLDDASTQLFQAQARRDARRDVLSRIKDSDAFSTRGEAEFQRLIREEDVTDDSALDRFSGFMKADKERILKEHRGSAESRLALEAQIDRDMGKLQARAVAQSNEQADTLLNNHLGSKANEIANEAWKNPSKIPELFSRMDAVIDNAAPGLRPGKEDTFRRAYRERITEAGIGGLIARGQLDEAEGALKNPAMGAILGDKAQDRMWTKFLDAKSTINKARDAGLGKRQEFMALFGREPKNDAELFQFIGHPDTRGDLQVEEIGDPNSPTGTRLVPRSKVGSPELLDPEALKKYPPGKPSSGLNVDFNPDGTVKAITSGRPASQATAPGLGTDGSNLVDKDLLSALNTRQSLTSIAAKFKPEFQQIPARFGYEWTALRDKLDLGNISDADKASLREFTDYRAEAGQLFADKMKAMGGTAITPSEAQRQEVYLPKTGTGIFDGDSPTELQTKIKRFTEFTDKAIARLAYTKAKGVKFDSVGLDDMPKIMSDRGNAIEADLKKRGMEGADLKNAVRTQISREFGFVGP